MKLFYQKEIGGILGACLLASSTPVVASEYQAGYSASRTCFKTEYREEYVPGSMDSPGYVKSWNETLEVPCDNTAYSNPAPVYRRHVTVYEDVDTNDCSDGAAIGALMGGGLAGYGSQGKGRWWAIPAGIIAGSTIGCAMDGG